MGLTEIIQEIKNRGITAYKIAEATSLTEVGINKIINGSSKNPRKETIQILENFLHNNSEKIHNKNTTGYYYPNVLASAGLETQIQNDELKRIPVTIPGWDNDISFINVFGDSMYPKYNAGEIIGVKFIEFQYLNYGSAYVIVFQNGDTHIKIVQPGSDNEHLLLVSANDFYKPKEFHLKLIKSFYSIKGVIKKEMM
jgi:transcriptional regulator with XRE-family HTH domain